MVYELTPLEIDLGLGDVDPEACWEILAHHQDKADARAALLDVFEWLYSNDGERYEGIAAIAQRFSVSESAVYQRREKMWAVLREALLKED